MTHATLAMQALNEEMAASSDFQQMRQATTVLGTGAIPAKLMLLGEQPGEQEDLVGEPFVGAAGQLLDQALEKAGIERQDIYITNTLKHYKFRRQGSKRLHLVPTLLDIRRYLPWLDREIVIVAPTLIVALGKVAARAALGREIALEQGRGQMFERPDGRLVVPTYHPAFVLRTPDQATRELRLERRVKDLALAARMVNGK